MFEEVISATDIIKITMGLLSIMLGLTSWLLLREIARVKEAIAIIVAANPEIATKVNKLLKPIVDKEDKIKGEE